MTKPETKSVTKTKTKAVAEVPVKEATIDTVYQNILDRAITSFRHGQAASLVLAWELGELFDEFEQKVVSQVQGRSIDTLIKDLDERGIETSASHLYVGKTIFKKYKKDALPKMAQAGIGTGHLKVMFVLEQDPKLLEIVNSKLIKADGTALTVKELTRLIQEQRQSAAISTAHETVAKTPTPAAARAEREERTKGNVIPDESGQAQPEDSQPSTVDKALAESKAKDDGKTGSRGATQTAEFTQSPMKVLKATDSAVTKLIALSADIIITATEITKVGFDHPPTKDKVREMLTQAATGVTELLRILPDVQQRLKEALDDVSG